MPEILLDPPTHTYTVDGAPVAWSVTGILRASGLIDFSGIPPAVLEAARDRGDRVHRAMALLLHDDLDWDSLDDEDRPYLEAGQRFLADSGFRATGIEVRVHSARHGYAGTVDAIGLRAQETRALILDWKTGHPEDTAADLQTAGYHGALMGMYPEDRDCLTMQRAAVHLRRDSTYRVELYTDTTDYPEFLTLLKAQQILARRRNGHGSR